MLLEPLQASFVGPGGPLHTLVVSAIHQVVSPELQREVTTEQVADLVIDFVNDVLECGGLWESVREICDIINGSIVIGIAIDAEDNCSACFCLSCSFELVNALLELLLSVLEVLDSVPVVVDFVLELGDSAWVTLRGGLVVVVFVSSIGVSLSHCVLGYCHGESECCECSEHCLSICFC